MHLIDKDKEILFRTARKRYSDVNREKYFREAESDSYYLEPQVKESEYLQEYEFQTPAEIKEVLEKLFKEKELPMECLTPVMVMALKLKGNTGKKEILMDTIYNF